MHRCTDAFYPCPSCPKACGDLSLVIGCSDAVSTWFLQNVLLLNPEKAEAIIFGTCQQLAGIQTYAGVSVAASGPVVHFAEAVKLLGVTLDSALTFSQHATNVIRACTTTHALYVIFDRCSLSIPRMIATTIVVQGWTIVIVYCMAPRKATSTDFSMYRINLRMLYYRHHGLLVLWTCAVNFIGCQ